MASSDVNRMLAEAAGATGSGNNGEALQEVMSSLLSALGGTQGTAGEPGADLASQIGLLKTAAETQTETLAENTLAVQGNTDAHSGSSVGSVLTTAGSFASSILGSGLGLSPLITGLAKLFGGGDSSAAPAPLAKYVAPEAVDFEGLVTRSTSSTDWSGSQGTATGATPAVAAPRITVQVNAMDSRSFLDHAADIARAVREAMLNSHSLNDVVNDL